MVKEVEERMAFLQTMETLGKGKQYRSIISTEISRVRIMYCLVGLYFNQFYFDIEPLLPDCNIKIPVLRFLYCEKLRAYYNI